MHILLPLLVAVLIGYLLGGRLRNVLHLELHWWWLAIVGLALQRIPLPTIDGVSPRVMGTAVLVLSYFLLLLFVAVNRWIPGAALMTIGVLLNLLVVTINGGMPVSATAIEQAGGHVEALDTSAEFKHHLQTEEDALPFLGDILGIPRPIGTVVSIGDLLLIAGICWFVIQVMRGRSRENPRPLAMWFLAYRGKHAPSHWRMPARYRARRAGAGTPGTGP